MGIFVDDDERKNYWNDQYMTYWKARVAEAGTGTSKIVEGDPNTEDDAVYQSVFERFGFNPGSLLEVGCAWGRMFGTYTGFGLNVTGTDISKAMIDAAKSEWFGKAQINDTRVAPAEEQPFADQTFDNLACLAVLDATYQDKAVTEFLRVTKPGAKLFFTGKGHHYHNDDTEAMAAEIGARSKNHPNYFSNVAALISNLESQGHTILGSFYFQRRGDFANFAHTEEMPERFYEFFLVVRRGLNYAPLDPFSDVFSQTFKDQGKQTI